LEWKDPKSGEISSGYREKGFFPEAIINFLALLGWNDGTDKEIYSLEELIQSFDLARVSKSGAKFDPEKNKWFNHQYLIKQSDETLAQLFLPILKEKGFKTDLNYVTKVVSLTKERANFVTDFWELSDFFFVEPTEYDEKAKKNWKEETPGYMQQLISILNNFSNFEAKSLEKEIKNWITDNEIPMGKVMQPLRISLVGAMKGPDIFHIMETIGQQETIKRLQNAIEKL